MARPLLYDLTHLTLRLAVDSPAGIDRVDLAYARYFASDGGVAALHYGVRQPRVSPPSELARIVQRIDSRWRETASADSDGKYVEIRDWILGRGQGRPIAAGAKSQSITTSLSAHIKQRLWILHAGLEPGPRAPEGAIYLNIAQHALERGAYFEWLAARPDVRAVFFLHDLLPLDFPEFWWAGHEKLFLRRVDTMLRHATALITTSQSVRERALHELRRRGKPAIPVLACPLPSPLETSDPAGAHDAALSAQPYFVVVGTIEPRKNHLLLLKVWRGLASAGGPTPKLVVIGARGWENEETVNMLERCATIADHVRETTGLSNAGMRRILANARAVLVPSFAEGFGLPLVEAMSLGVPVIASDIPVFREVAQNRAIFRDAIDGLGWSRAIEDLTDPLSPLSLSARDSVALFRANAAKSYFSTLRDFLASL